MLEGAAGVEAVLNEKGWRREAVDQTDETAPPGLYPHIYPQTRAVLGGSAAAIPALEGEGRRREAVADQADQVTSLSTRRTGSEPETEEERPYYLNRSFPVNQVSDNVCSNTSAWYNVSWSNDSVRLGCLSEFPGVRCSVSFNSRLWDASDPSQATAKIQGIEVLVQGLGCRVWRTGACRSSLECGDLSRSLSGFGTLQIQVRQPPRFIVFWFMIQVLTY